MTEWILGLVLANPNFAAVAMVLGILRMVFKPICSLIQAYVTATAKKSDDLWWSELQKSKVWGSILYILDVAASIKLPKGI